MSGTQWTENCHLVSYLTVHRAELHVEKTFYLTNENSLLRIRFYLGCTYSVQVYYLSSQQPLFIYCNILHLEIASTHKKCYRKWTSKTLFYYYEKVLKIICCLSFIMTNCQGHFLKTYSYLTTYNIPVCRGEFFFDG